MTTASEPVAQTPEQHRAERGTPVWTQLRLEELVLDLIATGTNSTMAVLRTVIRQTDPKIEAIFHALQRHTSQTTRFYTKNARVEKAERRWGKRVEQILRKHVMFGRIRAVGKDQWEIA